MVLQFEKLLREWLGRRLPGRHIRFRSGGEGGNTGQLPKPRGADTDRIDNTWAGDSRSNGGQLTILSTSSQPAI